MTGVVGAGRAQVDDPLAVGHRRDELRRLVRVARVEHGGAVDGAHHREVLERHLRRPVLADRDAGVRAAEPDVRPADRGHADEVVGAGQEGREGRGERHPAAHLQPDRGRDHLLLGDVHLEVALGMGLARRSRRRSSSRPRRRARRRRRAPSPSAASASPYALPRRDLLAELVTSAARAGRRLEDVRLARPPASPRRRRCSGSPPSSAIAASGSSSGLPCQPSLSSTAATPLPLIVSRDDHGRLALRPRPPRRRPRSIASTSCPSISIACQPKASARFA